jgi:WD40-like Beta Propeller Repeat
MTMSHRPSVVLAGALALALSSVASAQIVRISIASDGTEANAASRDPSMSATGRFVAFVSLGDNLVAGDTNGVEDVFLRDRDTDADGVFDEPGAVSTVRVSQRGAIEANGPSDDPVLTPDGRYVVFTSFASSLFAFGQPPLSVSVVLRWDRLTGDIVLVSQTAEGQPLLAVRSVDPHVSDDGNQVVFTYGGCLVTETESGQRGVVYRRDVAAGSLTAVSFALGETNAPFTLCNVSPSISGDGATIAYAVELRSSAGRASGIVYVVDTASNQVRSTHTGMQPRLSRDGAYLAFVDAQFGSVSGSAVRIHLASGERRSTGFFRFDTVRFALSPSGRYYTADFEMVDFQYGSSAEFVPRFSSFDTAETIVAYTERTYAPRNILDVHVAPLTTGLLDIDRDGLNDHWEGTAGLSTNIFSGATGSNGSEGDPDGDGLTNLQEFQRGSNPTGIHASYLAEGSAGTFFTTRYAIANPTEREANITLRFELGGGGILKRAARIPARTRVTFDSRADGIGTASFSAVIDSSEPVVVDRLMTWGDPGAVPYGSHAETASAAPGTSWLLAEGSTILGFQLFYLLQNPQATPTTATIRYLLPSGAPVVRTYDLPAQSRSTIYVNTIPGLESTDVSAEITATQPIAVERAMYRSAPGQPFALGHDAAAVAQPAASWFFGEGATGAFFDTYLLLANPSAQPASVQVEYLRDSDGAVSRRYTVPANSRFSVYVDGEPGMDATAFGTRVTSSVPIVAERAMYWAGGFFDYYEGHVSAGATQTGSHWVLAEGEEGGFYDARTFVLIANTGSAPATVLVRSLPEGFVLPAVSTGPMLIPGNARLTVPMSALPGFSRGGIEVVEQGTPTNVLVVEGAIYWHAGGRLFGAGANWPATRIP